MSNNETPELGPNVPLIPSSEATAHQSLQSISPARVTQTGGTLERSVTQYSFAGPNPFIISQFDTDLTPPSQWEEANPFLSASSQFTLEGAANVSNQGENDALNPHPATNVVPICEMPYSFVDAVDMFSLSVGLSQPIPNNYTIALTDPTPPVNTRATQKIDMYTASPNVRPDLPATTSPTSTSASTSLSSLFTTAAGHPLTISTAALAKATRVLAAASPVDGLPPHVSPDADAHVTSASSPALPPYVAATSTTATSLPPKSSPTVPSSLFVTASGRPLRISVARRAQAERLFAGEDADCDVLHNEPRGPILTSRQPHARTAHSLRFSSPSSPSSPSPSPSPSASSASSTSSTTTSSLFATARGRPLVISAASHRAAQLLLDDAPDATLAHPPPLAHTPATAQTHAPTAITGQTRTEAPSSLFPTANSATDAVDATSAAVAAPQGEETEGHVDTTRTPLPPSVSVPVQAPRPSPASSFFTTASGRPLVTSAAARARAARMMADIDTPTPQTDHNAIEGQAPAESYTNARPKHPLAGDTDATTAVGLPTTPASVPLPLTTSATSTSAAQSSSSLFTTASGRPLRISAARRSQAERLFADSAADTSAFQPTPPPARPSTSSVLGHTHALASAPTASVASPPTSSAPSSSTVASSPSVSSATSPSLASASASSPSCSPAPPHPSPASSFFATASGRPLVTSAAARARAARMMADEEAPRDAPPSPPAAVSLFTTARGVPLVLSEEQRRRAARLFEAVDMDTDTPAKTDATTPTSKQRDAQPLAGVIAGVKGDTPGSAAARNATPLPGPRAEAEGAAPASSMSSSSSSSASSSLFSTASGRPLRTSQAHLARAQQLLADADTHTAPSHTCADEAAHAGVSPSASRAGDGAGGEPRAFSAPTVAAASSLFTTASGRPVTASAAQLARAKRMFADMAADDNTATTTDDPTPVSIPATTSSLPPASAYTCTPAFASTCTSTAPVLSLFTSARGTPLAVSSASRRRAALMMADDDEEVNTHTTDVPAAADAASGHEADASARDATDEMALSVPSMPVAEAALPLPLPTPVPTPTPLRGRRALYAQDNSNAAAAASTSTSTTAMLPRTPAPPLLPIRSPQSQTPLSGGNFRTPSFPRSTKKFRIPDSRPTPLLHTPYRTQMRRDSTNEAVGRLSFQTEDASAATTTDTVVQEPQLRSGDTLPLLAFPYSLPTRPPADTHGVGNPLRACVCAGGDSVASECALIGAMARSSAYIDLSVDIDATDTRTNPPPVSTSTPTSTSVSASPLSSSCTLTLTRYLSSILALQRSPHAPPRILLSRIPAPPIPTPMLAAAAGLRPGEAYTVAIVGDTCDAAASSLASATPHLPHSLAAVTPHSAAFAQVLVPTRTLYSVRSVTDLDVDATTASTPVLAATPSVPIPLAPTGPSLPPCNLCGAATAYVHMDAMSKEPAACTAYNAQLTRDKTRAREEARMQREAPPMVTVDTHTPFRKRKQTEDATNSSTSPTDAVADTGAATTPRGARNLLRSSLLSPSPSPSTYQHNQKTPTRSPFPGYHRPIPLCARCLFDISLETPTPTPTYLPAGTHSCAHNALVSPAASTCTSTPASPSSSPATRPSHSRLWPGMSAPQPLDRHSLLHWSRGPYLTMAWLPQLQPRPQGATEATTAGSNIGAPTSTGTGVDVGTGKDMGVCSEASLWGVWHHGDGAAEVATSVSLLLAHANTHTNMSARGAASAAATGGSGAAEISDVYTPRSPPTACVFLTLRVPEPITHTTSSARSCPLLFPTPTPTRVSIALAHTHQTGLGARSDSPHSDTATAPATTPAPVAGSASMTSTMPTLSVVAGASPPSSYSGSLIMTPCSVGSLPGLSHHALPPGVPYTYVLSFAPSPLPSHANAQASALRTLLPIPATHALASLLPWLPSPSPFLSLLPAPALAAVAAMLSLAYVGWAHVHMLLASLPCLALDAAYHRRHCIPATPTLSTTTTTAAATTASLCVCARLPLLPTALVGGPRLSRHLYRESLWTLVAREQQYIGGYQHLEPRRTLMASQPLQPLRQPHPPHPQPLESKGLLSLQPSLPLGQQRESVDATATGDDTSAGASVITDANNRAHTHASTYTYVPAFTAASLLARITRKYNTTLAHRGPLQQLLETDAHPHSQFIARITAALLPASLRARVSGVADAWAGKSVSHRAAVARVITSSARQRGHSTLPTSLSTSTAQISRPRATQGTSTDVLVATATMPTQHLDAGVEPPSAASMSVFTAARVAGGLSLAEVSATALHTLTTTTVKATDDEEEIYVAPHLARQRLNFEADVREAAETCVSAVVDAMAFGVTTTSTTASIPASSAAGVAFASSSASASAPASASTVSTVDGIARVSALALVDAERSGMHMLQLLLAAQARKLARATAPVLLALLHLRLATAAKYSPPRALTDDTTILSASTHASATAGLSATTSPASSAYTGMGISGEALAVVTAPHGMLLELSDGLTRVQVCGDPHMHALWAGHWEKLLKAVRAGAEAGAQVVEAADVAMMAAVVDANEEEDGTDVAEMHERAKVEENGVVGVDVVDALMRDRADEAVGGQGLMRGPEVEVESEVKIGAETMAMDNAYMPTLPRLPLPLPSAPATPAVPPHLPPLPHQPLAHTCTHALTHTPAQRRLHDFPRGSQLDTGRVLRVSEVQPSSQEGASPLEVDAGADGLDMWAPALSQVEEAYVHVRSLCRMATQATALVRAVQAEAPVDSRTRARSLALLSRLSVLLHATSMHIRSLMPLLAPRADPTGTAPVFAEHAALQTLVLWRAAAGVCEAVRRVLVLLRVHVCEYACECVAALEGSCVSRRADSAVMGLGNDSIPRAHCTSATNATCPSVSAPPTLTPAPSHIRVDAETAMVCACAAQLQHALIPVWTALQQLVHAQMYASPLDSRTHTYAPPPSSAVHAATGRQTRLFTPASTPASASVLPPSPLPSPCWRALSPSTQWLLAAATIAVDTCVAGAQTATNTATRATVTASCAGVSLECAVAVAVAAMSDPAAVAIAATSATSASASDGLMASSAYASATTIATLTQQALWQFASLTNHFPEKPQFLDDPEIPIAPTQYLSLLANSTSPVRLPSSFISPSLCHAIAHLLRRPLPTSVATAPHTTPRPLFLPPKLGLRASPFAPASLQYRPYAGLVPTLSLMVLQTHRALVWDAGTGWLLDKAAFDALCAREADMVERAVARRIGALSTTTPTHTSTSSTSTSSSASVSTSAGRSVLGEDDEECGTVDQEAVRAIIEEERAASLVGERDRFLPVSVAVCVEAVFLCWCACRCPVTENVGTRHSHQSRNQCFNSAITTDSCATDLTSHPSISDDANAGMAVATAVDDVMDISAAVDTLTRRCLCGGVRRGRACMACTLRYGVLSLATHTYTPCKHATRTTCATHSASNNSLSLPSHATTAAPPSNPAHSVHTSHRTPHPTHSGSARVCSRAALVLGARRLSVALDAGVDGDVAAVSGVDSVLRERADVARCVAAWRQWASDEAAPSAVVMADNDVNAGAVAHAAADDVAGSGVAHLTTAPYVQSLQSLLSLHPVQLGPLWPSPTPSATLQPGSLLRVSHLRYAGKNAMEYGRHARGNIFPGIGDDDLAYVADSIEGKVRAAPWRGDMREARATALRWAMQWAACRAEVLMATGDAATHSKAWRGSLEANDEQHNVPVCVPAFTTTAVTTTPTLATLTTTPPHTTTGAAPTTGTVAAPAIEDVPANFPAFRDTDAGLVLPPPAALPVELRTAAGSQPDSSALLPTSCLLSTSSTPSQFPAPPAPPPSSSSTNSMPPWLASPLLSAALAVLAAEKRGETLAASTAATAIASATATTTSSISPLRSARVPLLFFAGRGSALRPVARLSTLAATARITQHQILPTVSAPAPSSTSAETSTSTPTFTPQSGIVASSPLLRSLPPPLALLPRPVPIAALATLQPGVLVDVCALSLGCTPRIATAEAHTYDTQVQSIIRKIAFSPEFVQIPNFSERILENSRLDLQLPSSSTTAACSLSSPSASAPASSPSIARYTPRSRAPYQPARTPAPLARAAASGGMLVSVACVSDGSGVLMLLLPQDDTRRPAISALAATAQLLHAWLHKAADAINGADATTTIPTPTAAAGAPLAGDSDGDDQGETSTYRDTIPDSATANPSAPAFHCGPPFPSLSPLSPLAGLPPPPSPAPLALSAITYLGFDSRMRVHVAVAGVGASVRALRPDVAQRVCAAALDTDEASGGQWCSMHATASSSPATTSNTHTPTPFVAPVSFAASTAVSSCTCTYSSISTGTTGISSTPSARAPVSTPAPVCVGPASSSVSHPPPSPSRTAPSSSPAPSPTPSPAPHVCLRGMGGDVATAAALAQHSVCLHARAVAEGFAVLRSKDAMAAVASKSAVVAGGMAADAAPATEAPLASALRFLALSSLFHAACAPAFSVPPSPHMSALAHTLARAETALASPALSCAHIDAAMAAATHVTCLSSWRCVGPWLLTPTLLVAVDAHARAWQWLLQPQRSVAASSAAPTPSRNATTGAGMGAGSAAFSTPMRTPLYRRRPRHIATSTTTSTSPPVMPPSVLDAASHSAAPAAGASADGTNGSVGNTFGGDAVSTGGSTGGADGAIATPFNSVAAEVTTACETTVGIVGVVGEGGGEGGVDVSNAVDDVGRADAIIATAPAVSATPPPPADPQTTQLQPSDAHAADGQVTTSPTLVTTLDLPHTPSVSNTAAADTTIPSSPTHRPSAQTISTLTAPTGASSVAPPSPDTPPQSSAAAESEITQTPRLLPLSAVGSRTCPQHADSGATGAVTSRPRRRPRSPALVPDPYDRDRSRDKRTRVSPGGAADDAIDLASDSDDDGDGDDAYMAY